MAKNSVRDFDATAANNTDIQSVNIAEGCAPSGINNAIRELMADMKDVSAGTIALESPQADSLTVTGDLTVDTNTLFVDASENAVGIGTASPAGQLHISGDDTTNQVIIENTSDSADGAPDLLLKRNSASPADNDEVGQILWQGKNDNNQFPSLAHIRVSYLDVTDTTEDASMQLRVMTGGSSKEAMRLQGGDVGIGATPNTYSGFTTVTIGGSGNSDLDFERNGTVMASIFTETSDFDIQSANDMVFQTGGSNDRMRINSSGAVSITGSISKGSGSFKIDHPLDSKSDTHHLVHSFVEAPQADNIYRGTVDLVDGSATVNIDTVAGMTDGTFVALNREVQCFTSNETGWTAIKGSVSGNTLTITAQENTCADTISWLVVGERKDAHMYDTEWTDDNGKVIVEPLKPDDTGDATPFFDDDGDD